MFQPNEPSSIQQSTSVGTKHTIEEENALLKDQVLRLNKELSFYQKKTGIALPSSKDCHGIEIPKSVLDCKTVPPLLTAYDHRIAELSTFIERQGSVLDVLTQRSNDLLSENESLRSRIIQGLPKKACKITEQHDGVDNLNHDTRIKQLLSDKQLLEDQAELLVKEVQSANQCIKTRDDNISSYLKLIQRSNEKIQQLTQEKGECEKELVSCTGQLAIQTNKIKDLKRSIDNLKKDQIKISSKAEGADMDKHYFELENESLTAKITQSASLIQELQNQLSSGSTEYIKLNEKYLEAGNNLKRIQSKMEQCEQSNVELKFRIDLANQKEKELQGAQRGLKLKVKEVELSRDKAEAKSSSLEKEVNRLFDQITSQESTGNSNPWNNNICQEIKRRDELIHSLKIKNSEAMMKAEKDRRLHDLNQTTLQNLETCITRERSTTKAELEAFRTELLDVKSKLKTAQLQRVEVTNEKLSLQRELSIVQESYSTSQVELKRLCEEEKRKKQECSEAKIHLQAKIDDLNTTLQMEKSRTTEEKESMIIERDEMMNQKDSEIKSVQCKIRLLEESLEEFTKSNQQIQHELKTLTINYTNEQKAIDTKFQSIMLECKESYKEQVRKNNDLMSELQILSEEKLNLDVLLKKSDQDIYHSDRKLAIAEEKISSLSKQLHDNLSDQSDKVSQIKNLKMELRRLNTIGESKIWSNI